MASDPTTETPSGNVISDAVGSVAGWWTNTFGEGAGATAKGQELDVKLAAVNSGKNGYEPGGAVYAKIQESQGTEAANAAYIQDQMNLANDVADTASYDAQVTTAAQAGAADGLTKAKSAVDDFFKSLFGVIPASIWIITAIGLFLYFGGWGWITRKLRKKASA